MPEFAEEPEEAVNLFYTIRLPIDLDASRHVELVFEDDGGISRTIDGVVIGAWARI